MITINRETLVHGNLKPRRAANRTVLFKLHMQYHVRAIYPPLKKCPSAEPDPTAWFPRPLRRRRLGTPLLRCPLGIRVRARARTRRWCKLDAHVGHPRPLHARHRYNRRHRAGLLRRHVVRPAMDLRLHRWAVDSLSDGLRLWMRMWLRSVRFVRAVVGCRGNR